MLNEDYAKMQLRLERIGFNRDGRLVRIPGPDPDDIGRVYAYRQGGGYRLYIRADVPDSATDALEALGAEMVFTNETAVRSILTADGVCGEVTRWRTYRLTRPDPSTYAGVVELSEAQRRMVDGDGATVSLRAHPILAIVTKGADGSDVICASCVSIRESDEAAESYVFTDPAWRRRGYGRQVTAAWAAGVLARGKVPFYSHLLTNTASARLVAGLPAVLSFGGVVYN